MRPQSSRPRFSGLPFAPTDNPSLQMSLVYCGSCRRLFSWEHVSWFALVNFGITDLSTGKERQLRDATWIQACLTLRPPNIAAAGRRLPLSWHRIRLVILCTFLLVSSNMSCSLCFKVVTGPSFSPGRFEQKGKWPHKRVLFDETMGKERRVSKTQRKALRTGNCSTAIARSALLALAFGCHYPIRGVHCACFSTPGAFFSLARRGCVRKAKQEGRGESFPVRLSLDGKILVKSIQTFDHQSLGIPYQQQSFSFSSY
ncbi:hypothetical protein AUEXF2481DRAFT_651560 [Aureobasidium subglaciale EXF-2481]|uniref:Uncharacterized protein n=1 Tax=Aureobasidium subglaciale (strain EXF-2481) TaxID=1043005 RepID=A0A074ZDE5_AURSE|nr:uncharacterized protein AUEXF2481DRAFT_651560 [Aureobasidium subglaciale EXF-2481]KEQ96696.1 hypothetical protein AUEXF2481DRAFT_651560 [Aureobasidium subglaciale EXF-2481]